MTLSVLELLSPEFLRVELAEHLPDLAKRAGLRVKDAGALPGRLETYIDFVAAEATLVLWERAVQSMASIDPEDVAYVATALAIPNDGIWSDDPHLKLQRAVPCITTRELVEALRAEGLEF